ncbi:biosynthetic-type acetolactate synthase large subunit [Conexibacter arvalis]|uniref:Acetolactate synthase n=1 Tax=Conexibacter arvalis TaxID=912552 RepID=A0A840IDW9_9ACTN|nr:biosynthetic-type acetolactate synthase large subunit [Conexibacter arvalis]MBB4662140.1 acetolactate synthase-1/2/3 large subunit [Conexibacter arvalis]
MPVDKPAATAVADTAATAPPAAAVAATAPATARPSVGADVVLRAFEAEGVTVCFGMPGGAILPIYDAIARRTSVRHVLVRHEQGAGHMAEGYARASGEVGVALATSGPGATNLVTPIANARMDSTPLVCVTGQVRAELIGTDAFQECDIASVVAPLVKRAWQVRDVERLAEVLHDAFRLARSGRPGPVLVDIPRDVQEAPCAYAAPRSAGGADGAVGARSRGAEPRPEAAAVGEAAALIAAAQRPVLYVGGGAVNADAGAELRALAERAQAPVVTTLMAKGALPESHPLHAGIPGMHGHKFANLTLNEADLVVAVGARFDDRVTGRLDAFAPVAKVVHLDVDPREIGKIRRADVALVGSLRETLARLAEQVDGGDAAASRTAAWRERIAAWRERFPLHYEPAPADAPPKPQQALELLHAAVAERGGDAIWTTGVGQHQMWAMQYLGCERPRSFLTSGGHGTMGFGVPAAVGARAARPGATVVCVDGDGSFQMAAQELATAVQADLPVLVVVLNNRVLGMVDQWQHQFFESRRSHVDLSEPTDCAAVARGFGARAWTVRTVAELERALEEALAAGGTAVLDVHTAPGEVLYPMIEPGRAAVDMVEHPALAAPRR